MSEATHIRTFKRVSDNLTALNPIDNLSVSTIAAYGDEFNMSTSPIISLEIQWRLAMMVKVLLTKHRSHAISIRQGH